MRKRVVAVLYMALQLWVVVLVLLVHCRFACGWYELT